MRTEENSTMVTSSRERLLLGVILVVGLLLRLTYLLEISRAPDFDAPQFEAQYHDYWARALITGDWTPPAGVTDPEIPQRPYFRPPGYPFFLALIYTLGGPGYLWPRLAQMVLGLASCLLLFRLARLAHGSATALFASALAAVYWLFIFFEGELMAVSLLIFLLLASLTIAARWMDAFSVRGALGTGLLVGLAALVRPNAAVLMPAFLLWAGWLNRRRYGRNHLLSATFLRPAAAFVAIVMLTTAPATLRNWIVAQDLVWITSNAGVNLFVGTHPESDGYRPGVPELGEIADLERGWDSFDYPLIATGVERRAGRSLSDSEVSAYFTRRAMDYARDQPLEVARLLPRKLALFWGPEEVSNNKVIHFERRASPTLGFGPGFAMILALAMVGGALVVRRARSPAPTTEPHRSLEISVLLLIVIVFYCASFLPFFVSARFRAPIVPLLILFAGRALAGLWRALAERRMAAVTGILILIGALRLVTGIVWIPYQPDEALWHWRRGLLWKAKGATGQAITEFQSAVAADASHHEARLSLAESLIASGRLDEAVPAYRAVLDIDPSSIAAHNNLARILAGRGDLDAAIPHWQAALEIDPDRVSVLNNLAYALATHPDPSIRDAERAVGLAEKACDLTGRRQPQPLVTLAVAYRAAGREADAKAIRDLAEALTRSSAP